jgi:DNA-directed RNA polymerase specialized sigma24 family protein
LGRAGCALGMGRAVGVGPISARYSDLVRTVGLLLGSSRHFGVGNVDTGQHTEYDSLRRAARLAASIAGASGSEVDEIAEESMARLLMQDALVNNPKAWVRSMATRLATQGHARRWIQTDDVLEELTQTERNLVVGQRAGYSTRELAQRLGFTEEDTSTLLAEANRKVRRSSRRLAASER